MHPPPDMTGTKEKELSVISRTLHWEPADWLVKTSMGQDHAGSTERTRSQAKGSHELSFCKVRDSS